ncbi:MAG: DUF2437 domain-containing protein [Actinobacteria bacterium]|nr:MAG: DUF2437 domain-containing protein [Actinomycetota bacterium]
MRLVSYDAGQGPAAGILLDAEIAPAGASVRELLAAGQEIRPTDGRIALDGVRLLAPVPDPEKIICLGLNSSRIPAAGPWPAS